MEVLQNLMNQLKAAIHRSFIKKASFRGGFIKFEVKHF